MIYPRISLKLFVRNVTFVKFAVKTVSTKCIRPRLLRQLHLQKSQVPSYSTCVIIRNHSTLPKTPELIYVPRVMRWLRNKFRFKMLQKVWDPEFSEGAFIYGTTHAVCRVTEIIHENKPEKLEGLVTASARIKLADDMKTKLTKTQRSIIKLSPRDIKILVPMSVSLAKDGSYKNCRIGMRVLALKWFEHVNGALKLVLVAIQTEFMRDYSEGAKPEWTISAFDILECVLLSESPSP